MNVKKVIKGVAKTTAKYTLKGIGKGAELIGDTTIHTVKAIANSKSMQSIATAAGILGVSVAIPSVGATLLTGVAIKHLVGHALGNGKSLSGEIKGIINIGNKVTREVSNLTINPLLKTMEKGNHKLGQKYQDTIDNLFR